MYIKMTANETIQATSQFCANNGFMQKNSHQEYKITFLKNIKLSCVNINKIDFKPIVLCSSYLTHTKFNQMFQVNHRLHKTGMLLE